MKPMFLVFVGQFCSGSFPGEVTCRES
jgi:hypothetical protein